MIQKSNNKDLIPLIKEFCGFIKEKLNIDSPAPKVYLKYDDENAKNPIGKTAYYDPQNQEISIYCTDRHPADIFKSYAHEMVHHAQNLRGDLKNKSTQEGYAQTDMKMRKLEEEAYLTGNMLYRDWRDGKTTNEQ